MSKKDIFVTFLTIFVIIAASSGIITWINQKLDLSNDNPAEQSIELLIQEETGVPIDLTPNGSN